MQECTKPPYISCIRIGGRPILPPVMFPERVAEMQHYRQLAIQKEVELMDRKRERHKRAHTNQENLQTAPSPKKCALPSAVDYHNSVNGIFKLTNSMSHTSTYKERIDSEVVNCIVNAFNDHLTIHESAKFSFPADKDSAVLGCTVDITKKTQSCFDFSGTLTSCATDLVDKLDCNSDIGNVVRKMSLTSLTDEDDTTPVTERTVISPQLISQNSPKMVDNPSSMSSADTPRTCNALATPCAESLWLAEVDAEDRFTSPGTIIMEGAGPSSLSSERSTDSDANTISIKVNSDVPTLIPSATCSKSVFTDTTPPSLASTNLAKYLHHMSPSDLVSDSFRPGTSTSFNTSIAATDLPVDLLYNVVKEGYDSHSTNSTVKASSDCLATHFGETSMNSPVKRSAEDEEVGGLPRQQQKMKTHEVEEPHRVRVRRSSYTLECPSPALVAHVQLCEEQGISLVDDMTSMSSHRPSSLVHAKHNAEKSAIGRDFLHENSDRTATALMLPSEDMDIVNENKQRHLENYLHNLPSYCGEQNTQDIPLAADNSSSSAVEDLVNEKPNSEVSDTPMTPGRPKIKTYEEMLHDQDLYIKQLTLKLKEEHRRQMALLMAQQEEDLSYFHQEVEGKEGFSQASKEGSLDDLFAHPSTSAADSDGCEAVSKPFTEQEIVTQNPRVNVQKYQLMLHIKSPKVLVPSKATEPNFVHKFNHVSARVKGYLTRRLLRTERVQGIIKTITDTLEFALYFHSETPVKTGKVTPAEANLHKRILMQLTSACYDFHDIFFKLSKSEQMGIISQDRVLLHERISKENDPHDHSKRNLSSATLKVLERKKVKSINDSSRSSLPAGGGRSKSVASWSSSPKRRKVSSDSIKCAVVKTTRPRTASPRITPPRLIPRAGNVVQKSTDQRSFRNARRNLSSIYTPEAKYLPTSSRSSRSLRPLSSGLSPSFSLPKK